MDNRETADNLAMIEQYMRAAGVAAVADAVRAHSAEQWSAEITAGMYDNGQLDRLSSSMSGLGRRTNYETELPPPAYPQMLAGPRPLSRSWWRHNWPRVAIATSVAAGAGLLCYLVYALVTAVSRALVGAGQTVASGSMPSLGVLVLLVALAALFFTRSGRTSRGRTFSGTFHGKMD